MQSAARKELQKQQKIFQQLEQKIAKLNEQKSELEVALADPATYSDKSKFLQVEKDYQQVSGDLGRANSDYETVFEKIMALEAAHHSIMVGRHGAGIGVVDEQGMDSGSSTAV